MCVFKYHAFIFFMRPPWWRYGTVSSQRSSNLLNHLQHIQNKIIYWDTYNYTNCNALIFPVLQCSTCTQPAQLSINVQKLKYLALSLIPCTQNVLSAKLSMFLLSAGLIKLVYGLHVSILHAEVSCYRYFAVPSFMEVQLTNVCTLQIH